MPSEFWINAAGGTNASLWGTQSGGTLLIFALFIALGLGAAFGLKFKNKWLSIGGFFMMLGFEAVIGMIDWIYVVLPLIVTGSLIFYTSRGGSSGGGA